MAGLVSLRLPWVAHNQTSGILAAPSRTATLQPQLKDLVLEQVVLPVCTARSNCPWPIAIDPLAAPTYTTDNALRQTVNSRQSLPCLQTTKASRTWHPAARPTRPMACLLVSLHTLLRVLAILAVVTMVLARLRNILTLIFAVLSTLTLGPSRQSLAEMEHLAHQHHPTSPRPLNSKSRCMRHPPLRSLHWSFL